MLLNLFRTYVEMSVCLYLGEQVDFFYKFRFGTTGYNIRSYIMNLTFLLYEGYVFNPSTSREFMHVSIEK